MEEVVAATTALGAHDFITALPEGYETDVANHGGRLSAGQRQLVAFARAFLADPAVLILDEATSSLDVPSERLVQHALRTVLAGRTAVIIAHRLSTVEIADRVLVMEHGRVVEDGTPGRARRPAAGGSPACTRPGRTRWPERLGGSGRSCASVLAPGRPPSSAPRASRGRGPRAGRTPPARRPRWHRRRLRRSRRPRSRRRIRFMGGSPCRWGAGTWGPGR